MPPDAFVLSHNFRFALPCAFALLTALVVQPGIAASEASPTPIYEIQGRGATSPLAGRAVLTTGVVTLRTNSGFFIQDPSGDGDPSTSDGIFVYTGAAPPSLVQAGRGVRVEGRVVEYHAGCGTAATPLTQIVPTGTPVATGDDRRIAPTEIRLPLAAGDSFERLEGMLVRFPDELTVQQNYFQARFGQLTLGVGRHEVPTDRYRPGSAEAKALAELHARSRFLLDDANSSQNPPSIPFHETEGLPRAGDRVHDLVGVLDLGPAAASAASPCLYRLQVAQRPSFRVANPRSDKPPQVGGQVRIASINLLNFFTTFSDGHTANHGSAQGCELGGVVEAAHCRGARKRAEFDRQLAKLVETIVRIDADALGLMEIQNDADTTVQYLVDALNARLGAGSYAAVPAPAEGRGSDAIRVSMIYRPGRLTRVGNPVSDPAPVHHRPPMAQAFSTERGQRFTLVVNHFKSKGSCPSQGDSEWKDNGNSNDGQGCWNARRVAQARQVLDFTERLRALGNDRLLLIGDFNAHGREDPIEEFLRSAWVDLSARFDPAGYSYVFDGMAGRLDHAIASASLAPHVSGMAHWHINADEAVHLDYRLSFRQPACSKCAPDLFDGTTPYRASDHDPLLLGLDL